MRNQRRKVFKQILCLYLDRPGFVLLANPLSPMWNSHEELWDTHHIEDIAPNAKYCDLHTAELYEDFYWDQGHSSLPLLRQGRISSLHHRETQRAVRMTASELWYFSSCSRTYPRRHMWADQQRSHDNLIKPTSSFQQGALCSATNTWADRLPALCWELKALWDTRLGTGSGC